MRRKGDKQAALLWALYICGVIIIGGVCLYFGMFIGCAIAAGGC